MSQALRGGGYELANLYPRVTGLPKTVGAAPGITVTEPTPGTYRFKGSTTTGAKEQVCSNLVTMGRKP